MPRKASSAGCSKRSAERSPRRLSALPVVGGTSLSISYTGTFLVFVYIWLPYMILPIQAALERVPGNLIEASYDLGAAPGATFRHVLFPLALPGIVAGSIFTFSLTLGRLHHPRHHRLVQGCSSARPSIPSRARLEYSARRRLLRRADRDHGDLSLGRQEKRSLRCALIVSIRPPPAEDRSRRRPALPAASDPADLRLRLHRPKRRASNGRRRASRCNGSARPGTGPMSGRR